jgi:peptidoglycan/xylan/chitin deacetylase (PgdA/CDA1 family)
MTARALAATAAVVHAAPLVTGIPALRGCWPRVAGRGAADHVALTFDDGPDDRGTPEVLDVLGAHGVRATFFVLGAMVERHPAVLDRVVAEGHEVAVHSWDHRNHLRHGPAQVHRQLARTVDLLTHRTGSRPVWFRPPYGAMTGGALASARRLGLRPVLWTAWGRDWEERADAASVAALVRSQVTGGGTVLLHDSDCTSSPNSWRATVNALPELLAHWAGQGLRVGPLAEHGV